MTKYRIRVETKNDNVQYKAELKDSLFGAWRRIAGCYGYTEDDAKRSIDREIESRKQPIVTYINYP